MNARRFSCDSSDSNSQDCAVRKLAQYRGRLHADRLAIFLTNIYNFFNESQMELIEMTTAVQLEEEEGNFHVNLIKGFQINSEMNGLAWVRGGGGREHRR
jgi:hypothetical protein